MARKISPLLIVGLLGLLLLQPAPAYGQGGGPIYLPFVRRGPDAPRLKWAYGGCYSSGCEMGWYSSPAVADVNGDGLNEVIASAYSLWALDGSTGGLVWRAGSTNNRTWPGVVVADLDLDGQQEIVVAQSGGYVSAYRLNGSLKWQQRPSGGTGEFRGLLVADLDGDNSPLEVIVTRAYTSSTNTWVLDASGAVKSGWPQVAGSTPGYAWGVYNANAAAGNLTGGAALELIIPSDVHYIAAYDRNGAPLGVNKAVYSASRHTVWGNVGVQEDPGVEVRGWGDCYDAGAGRSEHYRPNYADGPAAIADLNGDGQREVVVTGNMYDCSTDPYSSRYTSVMIFNPDRTRFNAGGFDWRTIPVDTGAPLSEDYGVIETAQPNPVIADLDGDGLQEILFASYDGRVHAFWLDKTEHGRWPTSVYNPGEGFLRFASEPVVVDLENDGWAEVLFTSWTQKGSHQTGKLHILSWDGQPIHEVSLPAPRSSSSTWNGGLPAPTLANIDADPDLEVIVNTSGSGVVVYDLPGTAAARILWGTGRGSFTREAAK